MIHPKPRTLAPVAVLVLFPGIATYLPSVMSARP